MASVIAFDLDGTLTIESNTNQENLPGTWGGRSPNWDAVDVVRRAHTSGWTVVIWTGRPEQLRHTTEEWLWAHKVPYHYLIMNKTYYRYFVDDRARSLGEIEKILSRTSSK